MAVIECKRIVVVLNFGACYESCLFVLIVRQKNLSWVSVSLHLIFSNNKNLTTHRFIKVFWKKNRIARVWKPIWKMVLQFLAQEYFARSLSNESIPFEEDFNQTSWNENNLDFYVPPHPLLYLVNFRFVEFAMITALNLIFPGTTSHLIHIGILGISQIYSFLSGLFLALVASPIFFKLIFVGHFGLHNYWNYQGWRELVVSLNFKRVKFDFRQTLFC